MDLMQLIVLGLAVLLSFTLGAIACRLTWGKRLEEWRARESFLIENAASERELLLDRLDQERAAAATERRELYSRIQAYDPNVGDFTPPDYAVPPSRPGEEQQTPRSFTEDDLGEMGLVQQADGMLRDTRNDALFEDVEGWRYWQADLRKRNLPQNVHPEAVRELGWEQAASLAKQQAAAKKALAKN